MYMHLPSKKFFSGLLSILAAVAILMSIVPAAYAASSADSPIPGLGRQSNDVLVRMHNQEKGWYNDQTDLIKQASKLGDTFQTLIDAEAKKGKNVSMLQDALANFENELTASQEIHAQAGDIIFSLVGWRSTGDVKDRIPAGQSLLDGRQTLMDANFRLTRAMPTLERTFNQWRQGRIHVNSATAVPTDCSGSVLPCPVYP